jgi:hypothetical protein
MHRTRWRIDHRRQIAGERPLDDGDQRSGIMQIWPILAFMLVAILIGLDFYKRTPD